MDLGAAGLSEQPFRTHGRPLSTVSYASYKEALEILENNLYYRQRIKPVTGADALWKIHRDPPLRRLTAKRILGCRG